MDFPTKIRSDYHHLSYHSPNSLEAIRRLLHPSLWILLGFLMGFICTKVLFHKQNQQIAFTEKHPTVAYRHVHSLIIEEHSPTANA